jgi:hypothetical protein
MNWLVGFVLGFLTVLAWQRVMGEPERLHFEQTRASELIEMYQRGKSDALKTTHPISMELEEACLSVWANKQ